MNEKHEVNEKYFREFILVVESDIQLKRFHLIFPQMKLLVELWKQLSRVANFSEEIQSYFCHWVSKILAPALKEIDNLAKNEEVRKALYGFLHKLKEEIFQERLSIHPKDLNIKHVHYFLGNWDIEGEITPRRDVVADLFQLNYAHEIIGEMQSPKTNYTDHQRISILLNFSLLHLSKCLFLSSEAADETLLMEWTDTAEQLAAWRLNQPEIIEDHEWNNLLRYYGATWAFQEKIFKKYTIDSRKTIYVTSVIEGKEQKLPRPVHKEGLEIEPEKHKALDKLFTILSNKQSKTFKIQALALFCECLNNGFKDCLFTEEILQKLLFFLSASQTELVTIPPEFQNCKPLLEESRISFKDNGLSIFEQQKNASEKSKLLLNRLLDNSLKLLGSPPCQLGLLALGSTSRYDRLPFSDAELALLYKKNPEKDWAEIYHYITACIALIEMQIIHLGESNEKFQGFWLDDTTSLRKHAYLRSDVEGIIQKGIREKEIHTPMNELRNPRNLKLHSFLSDPSAYSLVQPLLVNTEHGGAELFEDYQNALKAYLNETPAVKLIKKFFNLLSYAPSEIEIIELSANLTKRQMIALWVWWDVLRCLPDHVDLSSGEIDLKKAFHKPIAYFLMGLRLYYDFHAKNLEEIIIQAKDQELLSPRMTQFLIQLLEWEIQLRVKIHVKSEKQNETLALSDLSPIEQNRTKHILLIFNLMEKAISYYLKNIGTLNFGFELDKILKTYFERSVLECNTEKDYQTWFLEVTSYLLYSRSALETHRYYYRQILYKYRESCVSVAKNYFNEMRDTQFWITDEIFWTKLWDPPLSNGKRKNHQVRKEDWATSLNNNFISKAKLPDNPDSTVEIHSIKLGKFILNPDMFERLLEKGWITRQSFTRIDDFVEKKDHPVASRMPGNHLVIPWPLPPQERVDAILAQKNKSEKDINADLLREIQSTAQFYFKMYPGYPLKELFLEEITYLLGYFPPREVDFWLWEHKNFSSSYPILVSAAVPGNSLQNISQDLRLNAHAFSQSMAISALMSMGDNKFDNNIFYFDPIEKEYRLCLIDADHWFVSSFKNNVLQIKDIIFCLSEMGSPIDPVFREEFLCLNAQHVLQNWVRQIEVWGIKCVEIFGGEIEKFSGCLSALTPDEKKSMILPPLKFYAVRDLFDNIELLQNVLSKPMPVTHWTILSKIDARLTNHYLLAHEQEKSVFGRFKYAVRHTYDLGKNEREQYTSKSNFKTPMNLMKLWSDSNTHKTWADDIKESRSQLAELESAEKIESARKKLENGNIEEFKNLSLIGKEKLLSELDWGILLINTQRLLLDFMIEHGNWPNLVINNSEVVNDNDMEELFKASPNLKRLALKGCINLTEDIWSELPKKDCLLKTLVLENLPKMKCFQLMWRDFDLPHLAKLYISCNNIEIINIKASALNKIKINAPKLKILKTHSQRLHIINIDAYNMNIGDLRLIMDKEYFNQLNFFQYKTHNNIIYALIEQCPVFLGVKWEKYSDKLLDEAKVRLITFLNHLKPDFGIVYQDILKENRKQLLKNTETLFDKLLTNLKLFAFIAGAVNLESADGASVASIAEEFQYPGNDAAKLKCIEEHKKTLMSYNNRFKLTSAIALMKLGEELEAANALIEILNNKTDKGSMIKCAKELGNIKKISEDILQKIFDTLNKLMVYCPEAGGELIKSLKNIAETLKKERKKLFGEFKQENFLPLSKTTKESDLSMQIRRNGFFAVNQLNILPTNGAPPINSNVKFEF